MGKDNFAKIPNGTGGVEERMAVIWDAGVNTGRLTPSEFVAITSANTAKLFNIYPRKGWWPWARMPIWWCGTRPAPHLSAKTQHSKGDFNIFEGRTVPACPATPSARAWWSMPRAICAPSGARAATSSARPSAPFRRGAAPRRRLQPTPVAR
jgi:dihydropyrimidinase